ncbi:MAG TPA: hypothetical protein VFL80_02225 [Thermoanaerobaculia bacterium]|nr:hypothetical protein [Thermoanaerobaculia bacterium]
MIGLVSNHFSHFAVEAFVGQENREHLAAVRRLWRIPERTVHAVPRGEIVMRTDRDQEGQIVTFPLPPRTPTPFVFAHASSFAPFVMKVQYGWADGGTQMSFGEGGEVFVASFFGTYPVIIKKRPAWYF